jgi:hypothetical protein
MTAQISDKFKYKGEEYSLVAMSIPIDFSPEKYGITPAMESTACRRGYWCEYEISGDGIILKNLNVYSENGKYPEINGVKSVKDGGKFHIFGMHTYKNINLPIKYSGKILLGAEFIQDYYIHMGYQQAWSYKKLIELDFEEGIPIEKIDHSEKAELKRKEIDKDKPAYYKKMKENISKFVEDCFSTDMTVKACWIK